MTPSTSDHDDIDPAVFLDSDGQAYMYWGNTDLYRVRLADNMVELDGAIESVSATAASADVQQSNCVNEPRQQWRPVGTPSGAYMWTNLNSSQLLEVAGGSTAAGANVDQGTYAEQDHQLWSVSPS